MNDDQALDELNAALRGTPTSDPNFLRFTTGMCKKKWNKNVVSLGLASGVMEPLESTSIHLVQSALSQIMANFPDKLFNEAGINFFNGRLLIRKPRHLLRSILKRDMLGSV